MNALTLRNVTKRFGGLTAVSDFCLTVAHGEKWALIGPNGAGKTTLFNIIAGDLRATSGSIELFGNEVSNMPVYRRVRLGLRRTYQTSALFNELTVSQNLYLGTLGPEHGHMVMSQRYDSDVDRMRRVNKLADIIRLTHHLNTYVADLSHGERRQLEFGLAIASEPRFIMLDEPAAGLSADERRVILEMLKLLDDGITMLLIEHDMDIALKAAQRVAVMHEGRIIAVGSPDEIMSSERVQQVYLGGAFHD